MTQTTIICVGCPFGCKVTLMLTSDLKIEGMVGNRCNQGKKYVSSEFRSPLRVFTSTVSTEDTHRMLPVRTDKPVHKDQLKELARFIARLRIKPPVETGQEIVHDILGTGANLIATGTLKN
jgi:CxxC motif-containing protein